MKKIFIGLVLFLTSIPYSYGMSGDMFYDLDDMPGSSFSFERVQQQIERAREKRKRQQEEDAQRFIEEVQRKRARLTYNKQQPASSSSSSTSHFENPAGESPLELLPLELFLHIQQFISPECRGNLALTSESLRGSSQAFVNHLAIPISNITEYLLTNTLEKFKKVNSITIYRSNNEEVLTAEKITLLAKAFPRITSLNISNTNLTETEIRALARPDTFTSLKELDLSDNSTLGSTGIAILANAPFAPILESLNVEKTNLEEAGIRALSQPHRFLSLKSLNVALNKKIGDASIAELATAPFAHTLESLNLERSDIRTEGIRTLAQPNIFTSLKYLNLANTKTEDMDLAQLMQAPFIQKLEYLNLAYTDITDTGIPSLTLPDKLIALKYLNLTYTDIGDAGIAELIRAPFVHKLESLNLESTGITSEGVTTLATSGIFTALKELNVSQNEDINGDEAITALINAPFARTLESLNLFNTNITLDGLPSLTNSNEFIALKRLDLGLNKIGDRGMGMLVDAPFASKLESLKVAEADITQDGIASLATPNKLTALKELDLDFNHDIGDAGIAELIEAPFVHTLESLNLQSTDITNKGVGLLTLPNIFISLKRLDISGNPLISDMSVDRLLTAPFAGKLKRLDIEGTGTTSKAQKTLLDARIARDIKA